MDYKRLIAESWIYTQSNKKLIRWYGFAPALFTTGAAIIIMLYQFYSFRASKLFSDGSEHFLLDLTTSVVNFIVGHKDLIWPMIGATVFILLGYLLFPTLAKAAAINIVAREKKGQQMSAGSGLKYGYLSFLPLLEYHLFIKIFAFFTLILDMAFVLRNFGLDFFFFLLPIFIIMVIAGLVMTLMFTFADFFIVLDREPIFLAMKKSAKMVVLNWRQTFLMTILMLIIGIRIVIQAILVLMIPVAVVAVAGYLAVAIAPSVGVIVGALVGGGTLLVTSYLNGIVDVFSYAVWTNAFLYLKERTDLDTKMS